MLHPAKGNLEFKQLERKRHIIGKENQRILTQKIFGLNTSLALC